MESTELSQVLQLADTIKQGATTLDGYLKTRNHPSPSLAVDRVHVTIPPQEREILAVRDDLLHATRELRNLVLGPLRILMKIGVSSQPTHLQ